MRREPHRILASGMVGSGSTFLYNVAREILLADTRFPTLATYSDEWDQRFEGQQNLILKSHWGIRALLPKVENEYLLPVATVRHPGDCVVSDMERFGFTFEFSVKRVELSLKFVSALGVPPFRYEDRFTAGAATAASLARLFGIRLNSEQLGAISRKYDAAAVKAYANRLDSLPNLNRSPDNPNDAWCPTTQIHRRHIGAQISGRWRALSASHRRVIRALMAEDAAAFGYDVED